MKNYFAVLNLASTFEMDSDNLDKAYLEMQELYHPDKHTQENSEYVEKSALINKAYEILKCPLKKAECLLMLNNIDIKDMMLPQEMLMNFMEQHEEISEITNKNDVISKIAKTRQDKKCCVNKIGEYFTQNNMQNASLATIELKHLYRIEQILSKKLCNL